MSFLEMFGDLEKTGRQVQDFIGAAMKEIQTLKAECTGMREELGQLRAEHKSLHEKHEVIFGWLSGLDDEELKDIAEDVAAAVTSASDAATVATEAAAEATEALEVAADDATIAAESAEPALPETVIEESPDAPLETAPEKKRRREFVSV